MVNKEKMRIPKLMKERKKANTNFLTPKNACEEEKERKEIVYHGHTRPKYDSGRIPKTANRTKEIRNLHNN